MMNRWMGIPLLTALLALAGCTTYSAHTYGNYDRHDDDYHEAEVYYEDGPPVYYGRPEVSRRYYYYPSCDVYYDVHSHDYVYYDGGRWCRDRRLPPGLQRRMKHDYVVVHCEGDRPDRWHQRIKDDYRRGRLHRHDDRHGRDDRDYRDVRNDRDDRSHDRDRDRNEDRNRDRDRWNQNDRNDRDRNDRDQSSVDQRDARRTREGERRGVDARKVDERRGNDRERVAGDRADRVGEADRRPGATLRREPAQRERGREKESPAVDRRGNAKPVSAESRTDDARGGGNSRRASSSAANRGEIQTPPGGFKSSGVDAR